jgi:hypothetical protein
MAKSILSIQTLHTFPLAPLLLLLDIKFLCSRFLREKNPLVSV